MNTLYKAYCRAFQKAFHIAMPLLPYRKPRVLSSVSELSAVLSEKGLSRTLVVTDKFLFESGAAAPLLAALATAGICASVYAEVTPNPTISNVESARELYIKNNCEAIIAFGGGSSIDCAKGVGARLARPKKPLQRMRGILKVMRRLPLTAAIPTTAGTGSETTVTIVVTDEQTHEKYPISDLCLIPRIAVLDADVTKTLPPHITASTGMDALTHAVEAFIGRSTIKQTRAAALECAGLVLNSIEEAYSNGENLIARERMLRAAYLGGVAFSKSYVGYCHAVAHTLGGKYNIPHGLANAVLLPYVLDFYGETVYKKLKALAVAGGLCREDCDEKAAAEMFIQRLRDLNRRMGLPEKLSGIIEKDIPGLAKNAAKEANPLYPVPVLLDAKELEMFYRKVME